MRTDILIVTYHRDIGFLHYCLESIEKFGSGFGQVVLAVPANEAGMYDWVSPRHRIVYYADVPRKGMLQHLVMKCRADEICPEADAVLHVDPDCIFWDAFTPSDYLTPDGAPVMVRERYDTLLNHHRRDWRQTVVDATGLIPEWETMVRHPQIHLRRVYGRTRAIVEVHTSKPFDLYVTSGCNEFPQSFCEFNTIGAVVHQEFEHLYSMHNYDRAKDAAECHVGYGDSWQYIYRRGRDKLVETWSHGGIGNYAPVFDSIKAGNFPAIFLK